MSSFLVNEQVLNDVVNYLSESRGADHERNYYIKTHLGYDLNKIADRKLLFAEMLNLNFMALGQRYGDSAEELDTQSTGYKYKKQVECEFMQALMSLKCWLYQCAEGTADEQDIYKHLDYLAGRLALSRIQKSDEYDRCKWDNSENTTKGMIKLVG